MFLQTKFENKFCSSEKIYQESLSPNKKAQVLVNDSAAHQKQRQSLSLENKVQILCNDADAHRKQRESLPPEKR